MSNTADKGGDCYLDDRVINGEWGEWSPWSECAVDCKSLQKQIKNHVGKQLEIDQLLPKQTRHRECNNPAPLNSGSDCPGSTMQDRLCNFKCAINGHWTPWTEWSECLPQCYEIRTRSCSAPAPMNGGLNCSGDPLETKSCSNRIAHCRNHIKSPTFDSPPLETQLAMYAGLGSVVILLLLIFLLMLILFCRWRRCCLGTRRNDIYFAENNGHVRTVLLQQKQRLLGDSDGVKIIANGSEFYTLTTTASPAHAVIRPPTFTLRSVRSANSGYSSTRQGAGSRTALITECSSSNSSNGKTTLGECSSSQASDENYATLYDYVGDATERYGPVQMMTLPHSFTPVYFNKSGGRVELKKSGISLLVPENTLLNEHTIYIAISNDVNDRPKLPDTDTVLSATVMTGLCDGNEEDVVLHRPIIVSFKHCANNFPRDNWTFMLYAKRNYSKIWEMVAKIGEENINTLAYCQLEHYKCHVMTEQFGKLLLVGRPKKANGMATKRVRIAAFGPNKPRENNASIRIYCVPETGVAFRQVIEQEENTGVLLAQLKDFLLRESGSLCVRLDSSSGSYSSSPAQYYEIQDINGLWCLQSGVNCIFNLPLSGETVENRKMRVLIYQQGNADGQQTMEIDLQKPLVCEELQDECPVSAPFQLDSDLRWKLGDLLDTPTDPEKDWRGLAKKLDLDRYVQYFAIRPDVSPTSLLLDMWEAMTGGSGEGVFDLLQKLRSMGRSDAVIVVDQYLS
uniref:Netrin receptor UNC5 n=1 Tax=Syphacia muris TaxID=451379 RepID=A0A0N5AE67_9BILA